MFNEANPYFSVSHSFNAYLTPWPDDHPLPSQSELVGMQSVGLQLMSEVKSLEAGCLLQLRQLDNEAKAVVDYLKLQSRKVDLVLQHVIESETQEGQKYSGTQFGGSGIRIMSPAPMELGTQYRISLYIREELIAILCFARVSSSVPIENNHHWAIDLDFTRILEADIEQLVKASLSVQQKQLKLRKLQQAQQHPE